MKKLMKALLLAAALMLVLSFGACAIGVTCISHVDDNQDGRCDHCGQKVEIAAKSNVEKVTIKTEPDKTYYAMNEELDVTGGVITVTYNDGTPSADLPFTAEGVTVRAPGMSTEGIALVLVSYGGKRATYTIEIGAARFSVSFDLCYTADEGIPSQTVTINGTATEPDEPEREGYDFAGWYTKETYETVFDFAMTPITADTTVYAKWIRKYVVTYAANYEGGADQTAYTLNGKADSTKVPGDRAGYTFAGWYADEGCTATFNFDTNISENTTVYAKWVLDDVEMHTVTFNHNYGASPVTSSVQVADGLQAATPAAPKRNSVSEKGHQASDFVFGGWYTDSECKSAYNFSAPVTEDITLYAKWTGTYIFEAEHVSFIDPETGLPLKGMGASGGSEGANMVDSPAPGMEGLNASNGYYVTYLYAPGLTLNFEINADRDVSDATLIFRISAENAPFAIDPFLSDGTTANGTRYSQYLITLNGESIEYETIEITDTTGHTATGGRRPFSDFTIAVNLSLQKGRNVFSFITANTNGMGGTMAATAPVIDCIKVTTSAQLDWDPLTGNEFGQ